MQARFTVKAIWIVLVSSILSASSFGQNITLKGKLTDKADKTPISGATVALIAVKDSSQVALKVTDNKGNFQFSNLLLPPIW